jgi:uncharacterized protein YjbI with pentapeptide repeats
VSDLAPRSAAAALTFPEVVRNNQELERGVVDGEFGSGALDQAERLIADAARAGQTTWDPQERNELARVVSVWISRVHRAGRRVEVPNLDAFAGELPTLDPIRDEGQLREEVAANRPLLARRIKGIDLGCLTGSRDLRIVDSVVEDCSFTGIELVDARLLHTTFSNCEFEQARLPGLVATSSIFAWCNLAGAVAPGSMLSGTRFEGGTMTGASLTGASFAAGSLTGVDAKEAIFEGALFDLTNLEKCDFRQAMLPQAILAGATVRENSFEGADLRNVIFSGADVRGSDFRRARLEGAFFGKAIDVAYADFDPAAVEAAEFSPTDASRLQAEMAR